MAYLWMGLIAGLAAAPHCAGMCGAFPLHLSRASGRGRPLVRQLCYLGGKACTYAFLGALAGMLGELAVRSRLLSSSQNLLAYALGAVVIVFGLAMLGVLPAARLPLPRVIVSGLSAGPAAGVLRQVRDYFFRSPGVTASLLLGVATGFLPCPMTLAMAAAAAATHSVPLGMATMLAFGLGTAPVLIGIGMSGTLWDTRLRRIGLRGAGAIVIMLGLVTVLRPTTILHRVLPHASQCCHNGR